MEFEKEVFDNVYDAIDAEKIEEFDAKSFREHCENVYNMSTSVFLKWYEEKGFEGNVEQQRWYSISKNDK